MCKTHSCYLCSKRDVFKSSGFDFRSWKIYFLYHAHDYDEDYSMDIAELVPDNLKAIGVLWNHWNPRDPLNPLLPRNHWNEIIHIKFFCISQYRVCRGLTFQRTITIGNMCDAAQMVPKDIISSPTSSALLHIMPIVYS